MFAMSTNVDKLATYVAYTYLALPVAIFAAGWLQWYFSLIIIGIVLYSIILSVKKHIFLQSVYVQAHWKKIAIIFAVIFLWLVFSGIGGYSYQTEDHYARNAVLKDLINHDWPVVYNFTAHQSTSELEPGKYLLVYYIGHWLPAALVGKVWGSMAANAFLFLWTFLGLILTFYFICRHIKKCSFIALFIFILFSGMDVIPHLLQGNYTPGLHLELWSNRIQYSSNTTLLYWVYNQTVTTWLIVAMLLNKLPEENLFFITAMAFVYAPFPTIGLIPFTCYFIFTKKNFFLQKIKKAISFQNTAGAAAIFLMMTGYYTSNYSQQNFNWYSETFPQYVYFVLIEFLVIALILLITTERKMLLTLTVACLLIFPFIQFRNAPDFTMRASVPALFVLMMITIDFLKGKHSGNFAKVALTVLLIIGAITPLNEMMRSVYFTGKYWYYSIVKNSKPDYELIQGGTLFRENNPLLKTFLGDPQQSFFYQNFCRKQAQ